MVRRNRSVAFMGGAYVFPGGRVDDGDAVTGRRGRGVRRARGQVARCADLARDDEAAFRMAAIRELLEEAGVLLARRDGRLVDAPARRAPARAAGEGRSRLPRSPPRTACGWRSTR